MNLHARQIAVAAGAEGDSIDQIAQRMIDEGTIRVDFARRIIAELDNR